MNISKEKFEKLVEDAFLALPEYFKDKLENITIVIEDYPPFRGLKSNLSVLGLYHGVPYPKRGIYYGNTLPDIITIYQKPIEAQVKDVKELEALIRKVLYHEIGHYFGFTDEELYRIMK